MIPAVFTVVGPGDDRRRERALGNGDGQFSFPRGMAVVRNGHPLVVDTDDDRIQEFDTTGIFVRTWGSNGSADEEF